MKGDQWKGCAICSEPAGSPCDDERHRQHKEFLVREGRTKPTPTDSRPPRQRRRR